MAQPGPVHVQATEPALEDRWTLELAELLAMAAKLAATHELDTDAFIEAAWSACLDARPGLREQLEDKELRSQLRRLRKRGLVGLA